mgnify:CR=1 FL=1
MSARIAVVLKGYPRLSETFIAQELLGLERAGVGLDAAGAVVVDRFSQSNVPSIHAVGDVTNRVNLTPVAIREGHAFADTVFGALAFAGALMALRAES